METVSSEEVAAHGKVILLERASPRHKELAHQEHERLLVLIPKPEKSEYKENHEWLFALSERSKEISSKIEDFLLKDVYRFRPETLQYEELPDPITNPPLN